MKPILCLLIAFACASARPKHAPQKMCSPGSCNSLTEYDRLDAALEEYSSARADIWTCDSFNSGSNPFPACDWNIRDNGNIHWGEDHIQGVSDPSGASGNALRIFYPKDSYVGHEDSGDMRGGTQFYHIGYGQYSTLNVQYDIYFSDNFDFVRGGKLPGFYGGEGQCSGGVTNDCFSTRFHWREDGQIEIYGYLPAEECDWFCDTSACPYNRCNFDYGHSFGRGAASFEKSRWHTIRQYLRMNDPGSSNGVLRYYLDGSMAFEITGITIRNISGLFPDQFFFSTFFGGSSSDYASTADCYTYFRNFRIFT